MHFKLNKDKVNDQDREYETERLFIGNKQRLPKVMKNKSFFLNFLLKNILLVFSNKILSNCRQSLILY